MQRGEGSGIATNVTTPVFAFPQSRDGTAARVHVWGEYGAKPKTLWRKSLLSPLLKPVASKSTDLGGTGQNYSVLAATQAPGKDFSTGTRREGKLTKGAKLYCNFSLVAGDIRAFAADIHPDILVARGALGVAHDRQFDRTRQRR
jgi:hypothetical protein